MTPVAADDLGNIYRYISEELFTESAATNILKRMEREIIRLKEFPFDLKELCKIIEETPALLPTQKEFYKIMIHERKTKIPDYSMEQLLAMDKDLKNKPGITDKIKSSEL